MMNSYATRTRAVQVTACFLVAVGVVAIALCIGPWKWPPGAVAQISDTRHGTGQFKPVDVVKPFSPITDFPVIAATEVLKGISGSELVLGVEVAGAARAYPINMLTGPAREILNDRLGGRAIAATW